MPIRDARTLDRALADLIERRQEHSLLLRNQECLDRMITDLEDEISFRHRATRRSSIEQRPENVVQLNSGQKLTGNWSEWNS